MLVGRRLVKALFCGGFIHCVLLGSSLACGPDFEEDMGPAPDAIRYLGYVTDHKGEPIPEPTILVATASLEITADRRGRFAHSLGLDFDEPAIVFVCKKDGYKSTRAERKQSPTDDVVILLLCRMDPED